MHDPNRSLSPYALLGVMWCIWLMVFVFRVLLSPLLPLIEQEFGISHGQSTLLITALSVNYAWIHLPAGMLAVRFGMRRSIAVTLLLSAMCAVLVFIAPDFWWLVLAVSALGLALGIYFPPAVTLLSRAFPPKRVGRILGLHETASQVGMFVGSMTAGILAPLLGWREIFLICTVPAILLTLLFVLVSRRVQIKPVYEPPVTSQSKHGREQIKDVLKSGGIAILLLPYSLSVMAANGFSATLPLFLVGVHGLEISMAAFVFAVSRFGSMAGSYVGGALSDRIGRRQTMTIMIALAIISCTAVTFLPYGPVLVAFTLVFGFATIAFVVAMYAELSDKIEPRLRPVGVGLFGTVGGVFSGFSAVIMGLLADGWGFHVAFAFPIICTSIGFVVLLLILFRDKRKLNRGKDCLTM